MTMQDDRRAGPHRVAVFRYALWIQRFGRDPGRWFVVQDPKEDRQFQIAGVAEPASAAWSRPTHGRV
jgi:hypothetical protein